MIDTTDLTSYIPGYDEYLENIERENRKELYDDFEDLYDEIMIKKEIKRMENKVIDLNTTEMTFEDVMKLENYVWENDKLIPVEE